VVRQPADGSDSNMYTIYALWNEANNKIYIGQTNNIEIRLQQHQKKFKKGSYTASVNGDWKLVYQEEKESRIDALARERQLKSCKGRQFVRDLIKNQLNKQ
jgi:putative endonuclease